MTKVDSHFPMKQPTTETPKTSLAATSCVKKSQKSCTDIPHSSKKAHRQTDVEFFRTHTQKKHKRNARQMCTATNMRR